MKLNWRKKRKKFKIHYILHTLDTVNLCNLVIFFIGERFELENGNVAQMCSLLK